MQRKKVLAGLIALMVSALPLAHAAPATASSAHAAKSITIGDIGWDEDVAVNNVLKILLQDKYGYHVNLQLADAGLLYQGVSTGGVDAFMDTWLPNTQKIYWAKYSGKVVKLAPWYHGDANIGLAVPDYVKAKSIADLNTYRSDFGGQIVGIEAGSGEMSVVQKAVLSGYGLKYTVQASSTPAMLAAVKRALASKRPIVFTAWKPHWMFTAYPVRYLTDPKGLMGGTEQLSGIVSKGFAKAQPQAYKLISHVSLNQSQLGSLELDIKNASDPATGASAWVKANQSVVNSWLK